jgi:hypothetical protein
LGLQTIHLSVARVPFLKRYMGAWTVGVRVGQREAVKKEAAKRYR